MTKAPRVAFVVPAFPRLSETFVVERFVGLLDRGLDIHIVCKTLDEESLRHFPRLRPEHVRRVHVEPRSDLGARSAFALPMILAGLLLRRPMRTIRYLLRARHDGFGRALGRLYRESTIALIGPDIVHFEFGVNARNRILSCKRLGARVVVSFQGADINFAGLDADPGFYAEVWRDTDVVHTASEDLWRRAIKRGCPSDARHVVVAPVVNLQTFAAPDTGEPAVAADDGVLRILSVGRLHWKKGYEYGLHALRLLLDRGTAAGLRIVGAGPYEDALRFTAFDLGLHDDVTLVGALSPAELRDELRSADVFLHPAVSEGFSLVVLEAQASGVPVVTTDADGLRENVEPDVTAIVVDRRDPVALADALSRLAGDRALRAAMGRAGRERARTRFNPDATMAVYERMYRDVAE